MTTSSSTEKNQGAADTTEAMIKLWEKTIDVQMHFNELQMKVRNFSILLISSLVGVGGVAMKEHLFIATPFLSIDASLPLATVLFGIAAFVWAAFFFMDHYWYFPLLKGAVNHGRLIEDTMSPTLPTMGLTNAIGRASPILVTFWMSRKNPETGAKEPVTFFKIHSQHKSMIFYGAVFLLLSILTIASCSPSVNTPDLAKQNHLGTMPSSNVTNTVANAGNTNNVIRNENKSASDACRDRERGISHLVINQTFVNGAPAASKQGGKANASATATATSAASAMSTATVVPVKSQQDCN
jgi:hypothetical protein